MKSINTKKIKEMEIKENNYYVIIDFDKTITSKKSLDSWMAVADFEIYGEKCKKEWEELNKKYVPIELDYTIDLKTKEKHMEEWYQKSMDLLYKYNLTQEKMEEAIKKDTMILRKGAKEFLKHLNKKNIPVIILSAGIGNVIKEFLKKEKCYYDNMYVISNFIEFKEGKMQKYTAPIIHTMNKKIEGNLPEELEKVVKQKQYTILCGDIIEDTHMVSKEKLAKTLTIGFLNYKIEENFKFYNENYDVVLTQEDACFKEVEEIIKKSEGV